MVANMKKVNRVNTPFKTGEEYLLAAAEKLSILFSNKGFEVPKVRLATGWPHKGGLAQKNKRLGECWPGEAATEGVVSIFISPWMDEATADDGVLSTLTHGLVHAVVGNAAGHGPKFKACALAVGLEGKMTATHAGADLLERIKTISDELGQYPHAKLDLTQSPTKKQGTRLVKRQCGECGYTIRTTKKWIDIGVPDCPAGHGKLSVEMPEEE